MAAADAVAAILKNLVTVYCSVVHCQQLRIKFFLRENSTLENNPNSILIYNINICFTYSWHSHEENYMKFEPKNQIQISSIKCLSFVYNNNCIFYSLFTSLFVDSSFVTPKLWMCYYQLKIFISSCLMVVDSKNFMQEENIIGLASSPLGPTTLSLEVRRG